MIGKVASLGWMSLICQCHSFQFDVFTYHKFDHSTCVCFCQLCQNVVIYTRSVIGPGSLPWLKIRFNGLCDANIHRRVNLAAI